MFLLFSATSFLCVTLLCVKKTFEFEKAISQHQKIYTMKKATLLHTNTLYCFANLLNNEQQQ